MNNNRRTPDDDNEKYGYVKYMSMEIQYSTRTEACFFLTCWLSYKGKNDYESNLK